MNQNLTEIKKEHSYKVKMELYKNLFCNDFEKMNTEIISPKKTIILNENKEFEMISVFDNDGTIQKHSNIAMLLHNLLIKSSFNSLSNTKKRILKTLGKLVYPFTASLQISTERIYEDIKDIAKNLHPVSLNTIYTLNDADTTYSFLKQNDILKYFDMIIETENKNAYSLDCGLREYSPKLTKTLEYTPMIVFGDNRCDLDCSCSERDEDKRLSIGLESGLEKKIIEFKRECDIFVPKKVRDRKETIRHISDTIEKYLDSVPYSDKMNKTDIFKYMLAHLNNYDTENPSSY